MDNFAEVRHLREEYESALDQAEERRAAYHKAVRKLYLSGIPLRDIAAQLGMSHQRVHQIVGDEPEGRKRRRRSVMGAAGALVLILAGAGVAWNLQAHRTPVGLNRVPCSPALNTSQIVARLSALGVDPAAYAGAKKIAKICFRDHDPLLEIMWVEPGAKTKEHRVRVKHVSVPQL